MPMLQSTQSHLSELKRKHETIDHQLQEARRHPGTDDATVLDLKRRKLRLKDKIWQLQTTH